MSSLTLTLRVLRRRWWWWWWVNACILIRIEPCPSHSSSHSSIVFILPTPTHPTTLTPTPIMHHTLFTSRRHPYPSCESGGGEYPSFTSHTSSYTTSCNVIVNLRLRLRLRLRERRRTIRPSPSHTSHADLSAHPAAGGAMARAPAPGLYCTPPSARLCPAEGSGRRIRRRRWRRRGGR